MNEWLKLHINAQAIARNRGG